MRCILLVEDYASLQKMYTSALTKAGYEVELARNGEEALKLVEAKKFDLILLDLLMPGSSGIDFLEDYDVKGKHPEAKVIVLTNFDGADLLEKVEKLGARKVVLKADHTPKEVVEMIKKELAA